jgi:hypothetical protein
MKTRSIGSAFFATLFLAAFSLVSTVQASAQDNKKEPEERARILTEKMKTELSLTDEQVPKVEAINLKYAKKNSEVRDGGGGRLAKLKSLKASQEEKDKEMKGVLTEEQYKKYREMVEEMEKKVRERRQENKK